MSPRARLLERLEVLAVTAAPGGQRLLHFALVQAVCGTEALGRFANDLSIAMMLGLFSAVGWSALVLARVPVAAAVTVVYALAAGLFFYRALTWRGFVESLRERSNGAACFSKLQFLAFKLGTTHQIKAFDPFGQ